MRVWALWHGPTKDERLIALYESQDDAPREKDKLMDESWWWPR